MGFFSFLDGITGKSAAKSAKRAGDIYTQANTEAAAGFDPTIEAGDAARNRLLSYLGLGGDGVQFEGTPGYDFRFNEGQRAVTNSGSARGMLLSGPTLKALTRYGQGFASGERGDEINRLLAITGQGDSAIGQRAPYIYGQKGAQADSIVGAANAKAAGVNNLLSIGGYLGGQALSAGLSPGGFFSRK